MSSLKSEWSKIIYFALTVIYLSATILFKFWAVLTDKISVVKTVFKESGDIIMRLKFFNKILAILIFTLCLCYPSFAGTWFDDFERRSLKVWDIYNLDRTVEKWSIKDGEAVGEIFQPGFMSLLMTGEENWSGYSVECRAKFVKTSEDAAAELGLSLYDAGDENSRYLFLINLPMNWVLIAREIQGEWHNSIYFFAAEEETWYKLNASVKEGSLEFTIDDERKFIVKDEGEQLKSGRIGLIVANARVHFDDVTITGPKIPSSGPGRFEVSMQGKLSSVWGKVKLRRGMLR